MAALERFLHDLPERTPVLLKAAMAHVQFETIHPFLDGNGRVGRLLIPLILCQEKVLREPLLYMSLYLKQHRDRYFELLSSVRFTGDWESWILFFAEGMREMADGAVATARRLEQVAVEDRARIAALGRVSGSALRIHQALQRRPLDSIPRLVRETRLSAPTAASALAALAHAGIVREITGRKRNRLYAYERYLTILREGTDRE
jgi:Fic family protein